MTFEPKFGRKIEDKVSPLQETGKRIAEQYSQSPKNENFFSNLIRDIVRPYGQIASTVASAGKGLAKFGEAGVQYLRGEKEEALQTALKAGQKQTIFGYEPFESTRQAIGAGAEVGISAIGLKTPAPTSLKGAITEGAKFGAGFGVAKGLQEKPTEALNPTDLLMDTLIGAGTGAVAGAGTRAIQNVAKFGYDTLKGVLKRGAGFASATTKGAVEQITKNPAEAQKYIGKNEVSILEDVTKSLQSGVNKLQTEASNQYKKTLKDIPKETIKGIKRGDIINLLSDSIKKYDLEIKPKGIAGFNKSALSDKEGNVVKKLFNQIKSWKDLSPNGLNNLTKKIQTFKRFSKNYQKSDRVASGVIKNIRTYISDKIENKAAKQIAKDYAIQQDFLGAIRKQLGVKGRVLSRNDIINISKKISTEFGDNKGVIRKLLGDFEEKVGKEILTPLAVREMTKAPTKFNIKAGGLEDLVQVIIPKEFTAKLVTTLGIKEQQASNFINLLNSITPGKRVGLFNLITQITQESKK